jgi:hypothetical protein
MIRNAAWLLGYIWALPTTLIGFVLAFGGLCVPFAFQGGAVWFRVTKYSPWGLWWAKRFSAITFGGCVITARGILEEHMVRHELRHFFQARLLGPLFLPMYLASSALALFVGRDAYLDNPFERDAYAAEGDVPARPLL